MKVLVATEKPFAKVAIDGIKQVLDEAGYEMALLEKYTDKKELLDAVVDADAIIIRSDIIDAEVIEAAKQLKIVVRAGAGYDNVDLQAASAANVVVMNTPGQNANAVAELALGLMVYAVRNLFNGTSGTELMGKKLGIHAYGNVGRLVANKAKALGMEVWAFDPFVPTEKMEAEGVTVPATLEDLYANCDYISLHIPANEKTKGSINYELLSKMPKGGCLVNTARKEVIDEAGMEQLLADRADLKYVTDIAPANQAVLAEKFANRFFATPKKQGAETAEANMNAGLAAARQIVGFIQNGDVKFKVN
jgi:D-3-phosphoglycerate dehydrogenase